MRLKAEYLWKNKRYSEIHFNLTNGFLADFNKWKEGYKINVKNNQTHWYKAGAPSNTYQDFWKYMEFIFGYAGTLSFSKELRPIAIDSMQIGDVLIQGGSPGHVILVIDMCINPNTNEKLFLLAQSYMPAQETQILKNPNNPNTSCYSLSKLSDILITPEWTFSVNDLKLSD